MPQLNLTKSTYKSAWTHYNIDYMGYMVFNSLQQNPLSTLSSIADQLGVSITVVKSRLYKLKTQGFLRSDKDIIVPFLGKRKQTEIEAVYDHEAIGLTRFHIIIYDIENIENFRTLDDVLKVHPYTRYSTGSFSNSAMMYCQIDMPRDSKNLLKRLFNQLQQKGLFNSYTIFIPNAQVSSEYDFSHYDLIQRTWNPMQSDKDDINLETELDQYLHDVMDLKIIRSDINVTRVKDPSRFDEVDMKLLRELNVNAKIPTIELAKYYDYDQSTISRRLSELRTYVATRNILMFDTSTFNLQYPTLFFGRYRSNSALTQDRFRHLVSKSDLPFSSILATNSNKFFWMVTLPTRKIIEYSKFLWRHTKKLEILNLDISTSRSHYFLHTNYLGDGEWDVSEENTVTGPLSIHNL